MVGYYIDAYILEPHTMVKILESVADVVSESQAVIITRRKGTKEQQRRKYESIQEIEKRSLDPFAARNHGVS